MRQEQRWREEYPKRPGKDEDKKRAEIVDHLMDRWREIKPASRARSNSNVSQSSQSSIQSSKSSSAYDDDDRKKGALVYFAVVVYRDTGDASVFERMDHPEVLSRFERHVTPPSSQSVEKISSASQQRMSSNQEKPDGPDAGRECSTASGENSLKNDRSGTENSLGSAQCQEEVLESAILSRNVSNVSDHVSDVLSTPNLLVAHRNQSTPKGP